MFRLDRLSATALLAASVALAACDDSLSPDSVDPAQINSDMQVLASTFDNAAFQALMNSAPLFPQFNVTGILGASLPDPGVIRSGGRLMPRVAGDPRILAGLRSPEGVRVLFPSDVLGKTFVWDTAANSYVVGPAPGAPANGIRIILYLVNPVTGLPFESPLQSIGNLDLTDETGAEADRLGVLLTLGGATIADYTVTRQVTTAGGSLRAVGFVQTTDASYTANFDLLTTLDASGFHILYQITASDGTAVHLDVDSGQSSNSLVFRVGHGGNTIEIAGTEAGDVINGTIKFNGTTVGTISGPPDDPVIAGANGFELTPEHIAALGAIFQGVIEFVGSFADGIYGPALVVFN